MSKWESRLREGQVWAQGHVHLGPGPKIPSSQKPLGLTRLQPPFLRCIARSLGRAFATILTGGWMGPF